MGPLTPDLKEYLSTNRAFKNAHLDGAKNAMKLGNRYKNIIKDEALDFVKGLLDMSPKTRLTANEALMHPYFKKNREKDSEFVGRKDETQTRDETLQTRTMIDEHLSARNNRVNLNGTTSLTRNPKNIRISSLHDPNADKRMGNFGKVGKLPGMVSEENLSSTLTKQTMPKTYYNVYDNQDSDKKYIKTNWSTKNYGNKDYHELTNKIFYNGFEGTGGQAHAGQNTALLGTGILG